MGYLVTGALMALIVGIFLLAFLNASPRAIADVIRKIGPLLMIAAGGILLFIGRSGIAVPLIMLGLAWWSRARSASRIRSGGSGQTSTVRSAWLEMKLDHESGDLDGLILTGSREGEYLSLLSDEQLFELYAELSDDGESAALLEAYLDRRDPTWREHSESGSGTRDREPARSGPMTKEEAYQVLGIEPGASSADIRQAHRRLIKRVHPDSGGSTFLAARINEAKETLLN